jgi:uncharacterized protein YcaQ
MPRRASGLGRRATRAAHSVIERFGYLQLDTVSIAGARSHAIVLLSRIDGFDPRLAEQLLRPGEPIFEYWGHEACWLPMDLYPVMAFRREEFQHHPWWGDVIGEHPDVADELRRRIRDEGPLRSVDLEGSGSSGWWDLKVAKKVATALWSSGELAIRERRNFQRTYDFAERVIPSEFRQRSVKRSEAIEVLLLRALAGDGWAAQGTLAQTWRLRNCSREISRSLERLRERQLITPSLLVLDDGRKAGGWIRFGDLELAARMENLRPRRDRGVLLSPFDPVLWDRRRVEQLFGFHQVLEIFKPAHQRIYGYYCLPVLAGESLVARVDLKADRKAGRLVVLAIHFESSPPTARDREATAAALSRFASSVSLRLS